MISEGSEQELAHGEAREEGGQGEPTAPALALRSEAISRQGRQIHVEREGREDRDRAQQEQQSGQPGRAHIERSGTSGRAAGTDSAMDMDSLYNAWFDSQDGGGWSK